MGIRRSLARRVLSLTDRVASVFGQPVHTSRARLARTTAAMSEAPADVLKEARQRILGLMDLGISRDTLFNLVATSNPTSLAANGSNIPQQPLPTQSTGEVSREVKTEQATADDGFSRGMLFNLLRS